MSKKLKLILGLFLSLSLIAVEIFVSPKKTEALDYNNLMADNEFVAWQTLDADGIQWFLSQRPGTRLRNFRENGLTAAQIIANASRTYGINPVVLLATMQKEEAIVDSDSNFDYRVTWAMGYGICDGCDSNDPALQKYRGFTNQVTNAAFQFYLNYYAYASNGSAWSVGHSMVIDGTNVTFGNRSTSSLYRYTPHLPGNANFNRIYNIYRTYRPPATYAAKLIAKVGSPVLRPGQSQKLYLYYQNLGTAVWFPGGANPTYVGNSDPRDRNSRFTGGNSRWRMINTAPVYRYQVAIFSIDSAAPSDPGNYTEKFMPVMEGIQWFGDEAVFNFNVGGVPMPGTVQGANGSTVGSYNASFVAQVGGGTLVSGQKQALYVYYRNTGNTTWYKDGSNPAHVGNWDPMDRRSSFTGGNDRWQMLQPQVAPGTVGVFTITFTAPSGKGNYTERFRPVVEGKTWMGDIVTYNFTVR